MDVILENDNIERVLQNKKEKNQNQESTRKENEYNWHRLKEIYQCVDKIMIEIINNGNNFNNKNIYLIILIFC